MRDEKDHDVCEKQELQVRPSAAGGIAVPGIGSTPRLIRFSGCRAFIRPLTRTWGATAGCRGPAAPRYIALENTSDPPSPVLYVCAAGGVAIVRG